MKILITFLLFFVLKLSLVDGAALKKKVSSLESLEFMKKYGYLNSDSESASLLSEKGLDKTLKLVQKYGNIPETGFLDNATIKLMSAPRCGLPDIVRDANRQKRFVLASKGWDKRHLTYSVSNWSPRLGEGTVIRNIQKALDIWGQYGHLKFTRVGGPDADIIVKFPFDGEGSVLAHAFFPNSGIGGDIHFDDDEKWADLTNGEGNANQDGTDFFSVALHELGHSLGLQHSPVASSVMFSYYKGFDKSTSNSLDNDDILGMYELYTTKSPVLNICDGKFDSVAFLRGGFFIFKGNHIWRLKRMGYVEQGYPVTLRDMFRTLPKYIEKIDAAYERPDGMMVLFTDKTYLYKNDRFWRYNESTRALDKGYPQSMERWRGVPSHLDAVTSWNGGDLLFQGQIVLEGRH
ncbi:unnamed protein product [Brassicogethes aeneus]|uniref:Peptidase metallopeptidase domain-containing protein n=1 Tax=Brassicogethes aeneus TaxID=1431903 RepID=A0A9P0B3M1_BRAAE|nr:unnamed protein product [Brassicogethes aeneus]